VILIADTSALIALSICDSLQLLDDIFTKVVVPEEVFIEAIKSNKPEAQLIKKYLQGKVVKVDMGDFIYLDGYVDAGETEAMKLYKTLSADKLLIDDKRGRKIAKLNNISIIGSLGILIHAKQLGLIREVKPRIDKITNSAIYLNASLIEHVLEISGEQK
jgi:predicted nucleic acid-binding protein